MKFPLKQDLENWDRLSSLFLSLFGPQHPGHSRQPGYLRKRKFEYGLYEHNQELLIIAKDLKEAVEKNWEIQLKLTSTYTGDVFEHLQAQHPLLIAPHL